MNIDNRLNRYLFINKYTFYDIRMFLSGPCSAGYYMTETGCQQCEENTFSGDGASSCTSCPDGMLSAAGSTTEEDCSYGKYQWSCEK
jgi:hypothetical protein